MKKPLRLRLKQRWLPFVYAYLCKFFLRVLGLTCRCKVEGLENFLEKAQRGNCILMFWHDRIAMLSEILLRHAKNFHYASVVSYSRDGELISVFANSYKNSRTIRVRHNARATALQAMIRALKSNKEVIMLTPDGPRGPRYKVKAGVVLAARQAGACVIPMTWSAARCWKFSTWDQLMLPKPFATIEVKFGSPIFLPDNKEVTIEEQTEYLQEALLGMEKE